MGQLLVYETNSTKRRGEQGFADKPGLLWSLPPKRLLCVIVQLLLLPEHQQYHLLCFIASLFSAINH